MYKFKITFNFLVKQLCFETRKSQLHNLDPPNSEVSLALIEEFISCIKPNKQKVSFYNTFKTICVSLLLFFLHQ